MTNEYPPLDFDDLVRIMSPSPAPPPATQDVPQLPLRTRSTSPELPNDINIQEVRMNIMTPQDINGRENESTDMVRYVLLGISIYDLPLINRI